MPAKAITFSRWKLITVASLMLLGGALAFQAQAQQTPGTRSSPSSTAPDYGGATTEGGPGSINDATGQRVPPSPVPATSGATGEANIPPTTLSSADRNLMRTLAQIHLAEIDMAKMAQSRSDEIPVRSFAQRMIDDHSMLLTELKKLADARGVILPGGPDKKYAALQEKLAGMKGAEFTQNYLAYAGDKAHKEAHQLLQQAVQSAQDPALKENIAKSLPVVEQHLQMASHLISKTSGRQALQSSGASSGQQQNAPPAAPVPREGTPAASSSTPR